MAQATFELPELPQTSSLTSKGSLLPEDESFAAVNSAGTQLRRQTVLADGKGDLLIYDAGASEEMFQGTVISKTELTEHLYQEDEDRDSNVLEVLIGRLRRKLDPQGTLQPIETLRGRGYRFTLQ